MRADGMNIVPAMFVNTRRPGCRNRHWRKSCSVEDRHVSNAIRFRWTVEAPLYGDESPVKIDVGPLKRRDLARAKAGIDRHRVEDVHVLVLAAGRGKEPPDLVICSEPLIVTREEGNLRLLESRNRASATEP